MNARGMRLVIAGLVLTIVAGFACAAFNVWGVVASLNDGAETQRLASEIERLLTSGKTVTAQRVATLQHDVDQLTTAVDGVKFLVNYVNEVQKQSHATTEKTLALLDANIAKELHTNFHQAEKHLRAVIRDIVNAHG